MNVVAAGAGDFQRALGDLLPAHVTEVHRVLAASASIGARVHAQRAETIRAH